MNLWIVDAFASRPFEGNSAAVVVHDGALPESYMQALAAEMNLSETAFVRLAGPRPFLRWFTPKSEIDLCGHATLASAHVLFEELRWPGPSVAFETVKAGVLDVAREGRGAYRMDFPARPGRKVELSEIPGFVVESLGASVPPTEARLARDLMLVFPSRSDVESMRPDFSALARYETWISVTAPGDDVDFVSRFFCAGDGIDEDPVTGSAHCTLAPYWSERLGKTRLRARQASRRGGDLGLLVRDDRVEIGGSAVTVMEARLRVTRV